MEGQGDKLMMDGKEKDSAQIKKLQGFMACKVVETGVMAGKKDIRK